MLFQANFTQHFYAQSILAWKSERTIENCRTQRNFWDKNTRHAISAANLELHLFKLVDNELMSLINPFLSLFHGTKMSHFFNSVSVSFLNSTCYTWLIRMYKKQTKILLLSGKVTLLRMNYSKDNFLSVR